MQTRVRATLLLEPDLHQALRLKATNTSQTLSELVNTAVRRSLMKDAEDIKATGARSRKSDLDFEKASGSKRRPQR